MAEPQHTTLFARLSKLWDEERLHAWAETYRQRGSAAALLVRQLEIFVFTARSLRGGEITRRAAALTYHTLLAIVPVLAVAFALFKAFGGLRRMEGPVRQLILENLAVGRAEEVGLWLNKFVDNISAGAIAGVGMLLLFYSAISLLVNGERAFNRIWGVQQGRPIHLRIAVYWFMITVGPILLGASVSVSAQLQRSAFATTVVGWLPWGLGTWMLSLGSTAAVCAAFVGAFLIVPNTKVHLRPALLGGVVAGVLWSLTKAAFIGLSAGFVKYSAVYGALGALPLLMLWMYYSWVIVLFGVTFTYANQTVSSGKLQQPPAVINQACREQAAVRLLVEIARDFVARKEAPPAADLAARLGIADGVVRRLLRRLAAEGLVAATAGPGDLGYRPGQDIHALTVGQIVGALRTGESPPLDLNAAGDANGAVASLLADAEAAGAERLDAVTLYDLVDEE